MAATERKLDFKLTTDTPYLALPAELWDVYYEHLDENWPRFNGTALHYIRLVILTLFNHQILKLFPNLPILRKDQQKVRQCRWTSIKIMILFVLELLVRITYLILSYVIMGRMRLKSPASRLFTHSIVYLGADHRKHQSSTSLAFVRGIHRWPVNSPHKGPVARKMLPFDDVIMLNMTSVWNGCYGFSFYDVCARTG